MALATALSSVMSLVAPYLVGRAIDATIQGHDVHRVVSLCAYLAGAYLAGLTSGFIQNLIAAHVSQDATRAMRRDLFSRLLVLPMRFFDARNVGELMSRSTNDLANVSNGLNQTLAQFMASAGTLLGCVAIMFWQSWRMALVALAVVPLTAGATRAVARLTRGHFQTLQRELGQVNGFVEEMIAGIETIQLFHQETRILDSFHTRNERLRKAGMRAQAVAGSMGPAMNLMRNLAYALIALAGGLLAVHGLVSVGTIVSFLNYASQFSQPLNQIANQYNLLQAALAGAERIFEILDEPDDADPPGAVSVQEVKGHIEFRDVSFAYPGGPRVLHHIHLQARPGEKIAIVGHTGSGKTTLVQLLARFYDPDEGDILVDGVDLRHIAKTAWRRKLGLVLQEAQLFSGTIRENIRIGRPDATDDEIEQAAVQANADALIRRLPLGYDTQVGPGGAGLSQGERQLIAIARTLLANPSVLVLDEATSSVDTRTEMRVQEALARLMRGRTSIIIAHRLSTVRRADRIYVMAGGRIVEEGTHEQLVRRCGAYFELCRLQWGAVEQAAQRLR
ncbi:ABC transporter ATP-binding protein [Alicyclobacillus acidocaldarius]|uniref:ABC transporter related protein n=1 Tax=Alicyclobacillus acidocaldarius (strain Tc-4-1) TaxID=1048834 RepID=F8IL29_ALIAT|nr:ABC transporter ATP-binding protein [Alicyclobacillus acidocaldarius]AEJ42409.1 ABC transporter related protein [Alicyclobacillus acidocaldarius subsp. acidocaldarius Tc-4-1]